MFWRIVDAQLTTLLPFLCLSQAKKNNGDINQPFLLVDTVHENTSKFKIIKIFTYKFLNSQSCRTFELIRFDQRQRNRTWTSQSCWHTILYSTVLLRVRLEASTSMLSGKSDHFPKLANHRSYIMNFYVCTVKLWWCLFKKNDTWWYLVWPVVTVGLR